MKASSRHPRILYTAFLLVMAFCPLGADTATPKVPSKSIKTVDLKKPGLVNAPIRDRTIVANTHPANLPALFKFSSGGAVISTDPYYTGQIGEYRVFRDAVDPTLAYYEPIISIGSRMGTTLGQNTPDTLASQLAGVIFVYHNFDNPNPVKWGQAKTAISAKRPDPVTVEAVKSMWKTVVSLRALPVVPDPKGPEISIRYPAAVTLRLANLVEKAESENCTTWVFQSSDRPSPLNLSETRPNDMLNETETRSLLQVVSQVEIPGFEAQLKMNFTYPAWKVISPIPIRTRIPIRHAMLSPAIRVDTTTKKAPQAQPEVGPKATPNVKSIKPLTTKINDVRARKVLKPIRPLWIGEQKPRSGLKYEFQSQCPHPFSAPLSITSSNTPDYDYYFLSGSGRWGGPHLDFDPNSPIPQRPTEVARVEGWDGYWFETRFLGERTVWVSPRRFGIRWTSDAGMKPSLHFSIRNQSDETIRSTLIYDLFPEPAESELGAIAEKISEETGESVRFLPLTALLDFANLKLASVDPLLAALLESQQISIRSLYPEGFSDPWFRIEVNAEWDDWAEFTLFMRKANLGEWEIGLRGGLPHDRRSFTMSGDLLACQGAPLYFAGAKVSEERRLSIECMNFGFVPYRIKGMKLVGFPLNPDTPPYFLSVGSEPLMVPPGYGLDAATSESGETVFPDLMVAELPEDAPGFSDSIQVEVPPEWVEQDTANSLTLDEDISFSYLRSLCYRYVGDSEVIDIPVSASEDVNWLQLKKARMVARFQGYVYAIELKPGQEHVLKVRRIPREGVFADATASSDADTIEYRIQGTLDDGAPFSNPDQPDQWLKGSIHGFLLDFHPIQRSQPVE